MVGGAGWRGEGRGRLLGEEGDELVAVRVEGVLDAVADAQVAVQLRGGHGCRRLSCARAVLACALRLWRGVVAVVVVVANGDSVRDGCENRAGDAQLYTTHAARGTRHAAWNRAALHLLRSADA